jgi:2'-5' RNA ligase
MPHITLLYPFAPYAEFDEILDRVSEGCRAVERFEVTLERIRTFRHGGRGHTIWIDPEPARPIDDLQRALWSQLPEFGDVRSFSSGFTPHLSVGQASREEVCVRIEQELRDTWSPLTFTADRVALIWRNDPPDDVFRIYREIKLESGEVVQPDGN